MDLAEDREADIADKFKSVLIAAACVNWPKCNVKLASDNRIDHRRDNVFDVVFNVINRLKVGFNLELNDVHMKKL